MSNYENSIPFDSNITALTKGFDEVTEFIAKQIQDTRLISRWHGRYCTHLKLILLNLYNNYMTDPLLYTAYSRNRNHYTNLQRYNCIDLRFNATVKLIDILCDTLGYAEGVKGFRLKDKNIFRNARVKASECLIELLNARFNVSLSDITRAENEETIILKDSEKKLIDYTDSETTVKMRDNLTYINAQIDNHFVGLHIPDKMIFEMHEEMKAKKNLDDEGYRPTIDYSKTKLKRVFNNSSFEQGGRFYNGWWQSIPSKYRPYIRIDDVSTEEVDYSGLHINLLYAEEGLQIPEGDVYSIEGIPKEARPMLKIALQVMINSKSEPKALYRIRLDYPTSKNQNLFGKFNHKQIIEAFKDKHKAICKYFYTGYGVTLQYIDSQIAEAIMLSLGKNGIVALPVHDSFRVQKHHKEQLINIMNEVLLKRYGQTFKVDSDPTAYELGMDELFDKVPQEDHPQSEEEFESEWLGECVGYQLRFEAWKQKKT